jgi:hypothetical protein
MGPIGGATIRTYRAEGGALVRGQALIQGTADDQVKTPAAVATGNLKVVGIAVEAAAAAGDLVPVCVLGECIAIAGGAVTAQDICKAATTNGRLTATSTDNDSVFGHAVSGAAADGDEFVLIITGAARY